MCRDVMGEIDDRRIRKARQNDTLHDSSERTFMTEVGRYRDDAGWLPVAHGYKSYRIACQAAPANAALGRLCNQ